jgi:crotonobetainyl-CoA hydratase
MTREEPMTSPIRTRRDGHVLEVTLDRPKANAIDLATSRVMGETFRAFRDEPELRVAILTAAGEKFFCPGWDLKAAAAGDAVDGDYGVGGFGGLQELPQLDKPVIAAVNGIACGGGLELALACDIRIAAQHATFGLPEPKRAIIPAAGGTQRLPRAVPLAFAMELLMTGDRFDAETALRFGLVSRVVPADKLMATAEEVAGRILECGPLAVRYIKEAALRGREMSLEDGLKLESQMAGKVFQSEDAREGPTAFAQKRKPEYKGR